MAQQVDKNAVDQVVSQTLANHPQKTGRLLNALNDIQDEFRYLPPEAIAAIAQEMDVPESRIKAMGKFFANLSLEPVGTYLIDVCDGTACHTQGAPALIREFEKKLGIKVGETTPDGKFTLRTVGCVGACGLAPVVVANETAYARVRVQNVSTLLETTEASEPAGRASRAAAENEAPGTLEEAREQGKRLLNPQGLRITVGMGTCGRAAGAEETLAALQEGMASWQLQAAVVSVGCEGLCYAEPLVRVYRQGVCVGAFAQVDQKAAKELTAYLASGEEALPASLASHVLDESVVAVQTRRVMDNCGVINPAFIEEYLAQGGYAAFQQSLLAGNGAAVMDAVDQANLRGRGGAGFPAGCKWRAVAQAIAANPEGSRYLIVNGDEGDPGAYMDRGLLESDPHRVLEGVMLACLAMDIHEALFFIRAEYPLAVKTVRAAIANAYGVGLLGENILESGFDLDVRVVRGAGAYLCGESTAMINVLQNKACTATHTPPYPSERGLWDAPTCVNNVETLACVPDIVKNGAAWFKEVGTEQSPGTKILSITGSVEHTGLFEVPMGISCRDILTEIAGAKDPKAIQIGGPSGAFIPADSAQATVSFEGLAALEGIMGSGGFVVIGNDQCIVDVASHLTHFSAGQSCRTCKRCREALPEAADIFDRLTAGEGTAADLERLQQLAEETGADQELCGLGRAGLAPTLSSLRHFAAEYEAHLQKRCPGLTCKALISYEIIPEKCQGERCCLLTCPGNAIKGPFGKAGRIVTRLCQKCGMCVVSCCYGAVKKVTPAN